MKKRLVYLFLLPLLLSIKVNASTCSNTREIELSTLANNVKVNYVEYNATPNTYTSPLDDQEDTAYTPAFYIAVYNINDDLNVKVRREELKKELVLTSKDVSEDGVIYIDAGTASEIKNFTISIRSNDSNCMNEVLKTTTITVPMANIWNRKEVCQSLPDYSLCQAFTTTDYSNLTEADFNRKINEYKVEKEEEEKKSNSIGYKFLAFLKDNWLMILIIVVVLGGGTTYIVLRNRKKSRLI